jgi:copper chaperone CopZ
LPPGAAAAKLYHMADYITLRVTGMDCDGCVKAVTRAATGAGTAPISLELKSGELRLPQGADVPAITRAIQRAGFGIAE